MSTIVHSLCEHLSYAIDYFIQLFVLLKILWEKVIVFIGKIMTNEFLRETDHTIYTLTHDLLFMCQANIIDIIGGKTHFLSNIHCNAASKVETTLNILGAYLDSIKNVIARRLDILDDDKQFESS